MAARFYIELAAETGNTLYAVPEAAAYNTDNPLTEHGSIDGLFYNEGLDYGSWDIWRSTGPVKVREKYLHGVTDNSITADQIAAAQVGATEIATDAVTASEIAASAVGATEIAASAVTNVKIASNSVDQSHIQADAVGTNEIIDDAVTADKLATNSVTADAISAAAVGQSEIASDAVGTNEIIDDAVTEDKIADNSIKSNHIAAAQVDQTALASNSVGNGELIDAAVTTPKLADNIVTNAKLQPNCVQSDNITPGEVKTEHIRSGAVDGSKIAPGAITTAHLNQTSIASSVIQANAINANKLADRAVGTSHMQDEAVTSNKLGKNAVKGDNIAASAVGANEIADDAITAPKIADDTVSLNHISGSLQSWITANATASGGTINNAPDDVTIEETGGNLLQLKDGGITAAKLATALSDHINSRPVVYVAANNSTDDDKLVAGSNVCDGTDDHLVINPLIADNTTVVLLPGTYNVDNATPSTPTNAGCIHAEGKSNFALIGKQGAIIKKESTVTKFIAKFYQCDNFVIQGIEWDGTRASATLGGIQLANSTNAIIDKNFIRDMATHSIAIHSSSDCIISFNRIEDCDAGHCIDFNDDEDDHGGVLNYRCLVIGNNIDPGSGGDFDAIKVEDANNVIVALNTCTLHSGQSSIVVESDSGDAALSNDNIEIFGNFFIGGDTALFNERFGKCWVHHNKFIQQKVQVGGGGAGGYLYFDDNYIEGKTGINSSLSLFAGEDAGNRIYIRRNNIKAPYESSESRAIDVAHNGSTTHYHLWVEGNHIWNFYTSGIEIDADFDSYVTILNNTIEGGGSSGNLDGIEMQGVIGGIIRGNRFVGCKRSVRLISTQNVDVQDNVIDPQASATIGIGEEGSSNNNYIERNRFIGSGLGRLQKVVTVGANTIIQGNRGGGDIETELEGVVTIVAESGFIDITLPANFSTGVEKQFQLWFASDPDAIENVYPSFQSANTVRVNVGQGSNPTVNVDIGYRARNLHQYFAS